MLKYNQSEIYNQLEKVKYNSRSFSADKERIPLARAQLMVFNRKGERLGVLENADEPILEQEINSIDTLTFSLPFTDPKKEYIQNENYVQIADKRYIVRRINKIRSASTFEIQVYCEATWYDLQRSEPMKVWKWENATPAEMLYDMLDETDWNVGRVEIDQRRNLDLEESFVNRIKALRELPKVFDGELDFDTANNLVHFIKPIGKDSGASIVYRKNMEEIDAEYSTEELTTKLYLYGKENLSIKDAHPKGLEYIENYQYTKEKYVRVTKDERFTNPYHLYERGLYALDVLSKPVGSYIIKLADLSALTGLSHESFNLGDSVWVYDTELDLNERKRIMKWRYNVKRPWDTEIELENPRPTMSSLLTGIQEGDSFLQSEDAVQRDDMLNLSVFNLLLNSRADDGFSYWQNTGWEIDPMNGYSGNSSFKAVGEPGRKKELKQVVYPSHRDEYSISFRASTDNIQLGPNGKVGVYVTIKYEDGTEDDPVFIPLIEGES